MAINFGENEGGYANFGSASIFDNLAKGSVAVIAHSAILGAGRTYKAKGNGDGASGAGWRLDQRGNGTRLGFAVHRATTHAVVRSNVDVIQVNDWQLFAASWDLRGVSDFMRLYMGNYSNRTALTETAYEAGYPVLGTGALTDDAARNLRGANNDPNVDADAFSGKIGISVLFNDPLDEGDWRRFMWKPSMLLDTSICLGFWIWGLFGLSVQDYSGRANPGTITAGATTRVSRHIDTLGFHFANKRRTVRPVSAPAAPPVRWFPRVGGW